MYDKRFKYIQWFSYILLGLSAILGLLFYLNTSSTGAMNNMLYWMYLVGILAIVAILTTALTTIFVNPKGAFKILLVIAAMVVLGIICYAISTNEFDIIQLEKMKVTASTSKSIGAALYFTYVVVIATFGSLIYAAVIRFFR